MAPRKTTWFIISAFLWLWAALAAGLHFTEMPALFNLSPTAAGTAFVYWGAYELYLFILLALFVVFTRPGSRIMIAAGGIGLSVAVKVLWLEPLLQFRVQTILEGMRPFNFIPLLYVISEIVKISLLLYTSYWIYMRWAAPARQKNRSQHLASDQPIRGRQLHHPT